MISKTSVVAIASVAAALMSTAALAAGTAPNGTVDVSKTTIGAPPVPVTVPPLPTATPTTLITPATLVTVPVGARRLTDGTGRISVLVPSTWTDTNTSPTMRNDGGTRPVINAAPDIAAMLDTWTTPGLWMTAFPATVDPANWLTLYSFSGACTPGPVEPVNDGRWVGSMQTWNGCGGGTAQMVHFAARSADGTFGVFAQIQALTPGEPAVALVLGSIALVPGASMAPPTTVGAPVVTVGPADPTLVGAALPADVTRLVDDTGRFALSVPATWIDIDLTPDQNDDGSGRSAIRAAPNLDAFWARWDTAGLTALLLPYVDPVTFLRNRPSLGCRDGGLTPVATATHSGFIHTYTACGGTKGRTLELAISPPDLSSTFVLFIQLPDPDNTPLAVVLASFHLL